MDQVGLDGGHPQLGSLPVGRLVGLGLDSFFGSARLGWALLGGRLCLLLLRRACSRLRLWLLGGGLIFFLVFLVFGAASIPLIVALVAGGVDGALRLRHGALCGGGEGRRGATIAAPRVRARSRVGAEAADRNCRNQSKGRGSSPPRISVSAEAAPAQPAPCALAGRRARAKRGAEPRAASPEPTRANW